MCWPRCFKSGAHSIQARIVLELQLPLPCDGYAPVPWPCSHMAGPGTAVVGGLNCCETGVWPGSRWAVDKQCVKPLKTGDCRNSECIMCLRNGVPFVTNRTATKTLKERTLRAFSQLVGEKGSDALNTPCSFQALYDLYCGILIPKAHELSYKLSKGAVQAWSCLQSLSFCIVHDSQQHYKMSQPGCSCPCLQQSKSFHA